MIKKRIIFIILIILAIFTVKTQARSIEENNLTNPIIENIDIIDSILNIRLGASNDSINIEDMEKGKEVPHEHIYVLKWDTRDENGKLLEPEKSHHWLECKVCPDYGMKPSIIEYASHQLEYTGGHIENGVSGPTCAYYEENYTAFCTKEGCDYKYEYPKSAHERSETKQLSSKERPIHYAYCTAEPRHPWIYSDYCYFHDKNGKKVMIGCGNLRGNTPSTGVGKCEECGREYKKAAHRLLQPGYDYSYCYWCQKKFIVRCKENEGYTLKTEILDYHTRRITATIKSITNEIKIKPQTLRYGTWTTSVSGWDLSKVESIVENRDGSVTVTGIITTNAQNHAQTWAVFLYGEYIDKTDPNLETYNFYIYLDAGGPIKGGNCGSVYLVATDYLPPHINPVIVEGNGNPNKMSKQATIKISCQEDWVSKVNSVKIRILDENGKPMLEDGVTDKEGYREITQFEKDSKGNPTGEFKAIIDFKNEVREPQTYHVQIKDISGNVTSLNDKNAAFTVQYIDCKAPTLDASCKTVYLGDWKDEENVELVIREEGVGNVQVCFNEYSEDNFQKAIKDPVNGDLYRLTIPVKGDIYEDGGKEYAIYLRDGAGNIRTEYITIGKLDRTAPTVLKTERSADGETITITANDKSEVTGTEGSGRNGNLRYAITVDTTSTQDIDSTIPPDSAFQKSPIFTIPKNQVYYIWIKDPAGNLAFYVPEEIELTGTYKGIDETKIDYRGLVTEEGRGDNYIGLKWRVLNNEIDVTKGYTFRLMQRKTKEEDIQSVSVKYGKQVKVLNVYPTGRLGHEVARTPITMRSWRDGGKEISIPKSASLKKWMEEPNSYNPQGFGQGMIMVDIVSIDEYNVNPNKYLKGNDNTYDYDVIVFGTWDCNGRQDLSDISVNATREFVNTGRGVLFGHDTLTYHDENGIGEDGCHHWYFNKLSDTVNMEVQEKIGAIPWVGGEYVQVIKKGYITKYPYYIEDRTLKVPISHTTGERANGNIWIQYVAPFGSGYTTGTGTNNYFITTWNNCAVTRTGHSNCEATDDEQMILSNVIWYLGQVTDDTNAEAHTAEDTTGPERPLVSIGSDEKNTKFSIDVHVEDRGNAYELQIKGQHNKIAYITNNSAVGIRVGDTVVLAGETKAVNIGDTRNSSTVNEEVKVGVQGFAWLISDKDTIEKLSEAEKEQLKKINEVPTEIDFITNLNKYLYIRGIDWEGNLGELAIVQITPGELIPKEELKEKLFCVQYGVTIPAKTESGVEITANVKLESTDGGKSQPTTWVRVEQPALGDIIGRKFIQSPIWKYWDDNGKGQKSYSIGKYKISIEKTPVTIDSSKKWNATNMESYILQYWEDHTDANSYVQQALYSTEIAQRLGNNKKPTNITIKAQELVQEARSYAQYREAYKEPKKVEYEEKAYITEDYKSWLIGPFELNYTVAAIKVGSREPVYFSKIIGAKIYDQNGNLVGEKDKNGTTTGKLKWEFVYLNKGTERDQELFSYEKYKFPVNKEQYYIKITDLPADITSISKIEYQFQKLITNARYEVLQGTYNIATWKNNNINENTPETSEEVIWCQGGEQCTHYPHYDRAHLVGAYRYLKCTNINEGTPNNQALESQMLIRLQANEKYYDTQTILTVHSNTETTGKWKLSVDVYGNVWDDGIEDSSAVNGIKETNEKAVTNVKVTMYRVDKNKVRTGVKYETRTTDGGNYSYKDMLGGLYDIEFEFDGQTYTTTKLLASGNVADYKKDYKGTKYAYDSIAIETKEERQTLNNKFEEIYADSTSRNGEEKVTSKLQYKKNEDGTSTIITSDGNVVKEQYRLEARTSTNGVYYPIVPSNTIGTDTVLEMKDVYNANLGLLERLKTNENLKLDVYKTIFGIKDLKQEYIYSGKNIRNIDSNIKIDKYTQKINQSDYEWRWSSDLSSIWETAEECELKSYIDYIIVIRNSGEKDYVKISELADYYSNNLRYDNNGYRDVKTSSYAYLKWDKAEESINQIIDTKEKITWKEGQSKYGYKNPNMTGYNDLYTEDLKDWKLQKGQYIEVHIVFEVKEKTNTEMGVTTKEKLALNEEFENYSEIFGYKTYYKADNSVAGLIDENSQPGNITPSIINKEDDEDKAPDMIYELDVYDPNKGNGENGNGGNNGNGSNNSGNSKNYGNVIEGNVWEDLRTGENTLKLKNNQIIADGIMQDNEPLVNDVKVELIEILKNKKGDALERTIKTARTANIYSINKDSNKAGGYCFTNLASGNYKLKFTFGDYEQVEKEATYNGQDYQAKYTPDIYGGELVDNFSNVEIMLAVDVSQSMEGEPLAQEKQALSKLVGELMEKLPGVKIGLVKFASTATTIQQATNNKQAIINKINSLSIEEKTNISEGLEQALLGYSKNTENKIIILITDGQETVTSIEEVRRTLEKTVDQEEINLITLLTKPSEDIFGTEENPTRGKLYNVTENSIGKAIEGIYEEVLENSIVENNRSLASEVEGNKEDPEKGTRWYNLINYKVIDPEKGEILAIENIKEMPEKTEEEKRKKEEALAKFADETYMTAISKTSTFKPNNVGKTRLHQINLGLVERPKVELKIEAEIKDFSITLSDGTVLIDTEKGMKKNVSGFAEGVPDLPIFAYVDEEIMHGATLKVKYRIKITNIGEIDTLSNYIKGESTGTIPTTALIAYNYTNKNMLYREDNAESSMWTELEIEDVNMSRDAKKALKGDKENTKVYATTELAKELYPENSIEAQNGEITFVEAYATMSKMLSPENESETLRYDSAIEIVQRENSAGRRSYTSVPGNYYKEKGNIEPDTAVTQSIIISKPLGERIVEYITYILPLSALAIFVTILRKKNKK